MQALTSKGVLVLVTTNYGNAQWITYDLSKFSVCEDPVIRWETNTDGGGLKYAMNTDAQLCGDSLTLYFEANTVQTLEMACLV